MTRSFLGLIAVALCAVAAAAPAAATAATAELPLRLVEPQAGATLVAGSYATVEWEPLSGHAGEIAGEEWEAFLSLDSGATYPIRLTPHLSRALRQFSFRVPSLPTSSARLLLRVGDERREGEYELPQLFTIAAAAVPGVPLDLRRIELRRGEPARAGEPGVVAWVEGTRRGDSTREVVAADPPTATAAVDFSLDDAPAWLAVPAEGPLSAAPPGRQVEPREIAPARPSAPLRSTPPPSAAAPDLLSLLQRRNE